ncbi:unnamed protein product [Urochloa decumbens]|uniref:F-box domain-containing protein n=1 Tax=Urochloa decumbens TaxID=240449 RepID=A0ABC9D693_9POAL
MAPSARTLPDDLIPGILVRLAPDDPAGVIRASAVCKSWRRILADPAFSARYRALHPAASTLGFIHNPSDNLQISRFVPTSPFRPSPAADHHTRHAHDCRHGRVLFYDYDSRRPTNNGFAVWDPISGDLMRSFRPSTEAWTQQAVLCAAAADGCDHRGCCGGPFIVAAVAMGFDDDDETEGKSSTAQAEFYSSETGEWGMHVYTDVGTPFELKDRPAALVGDSLYFVGDSGILLRYRYDLLRRRLREKNRCIRDSEYLSVIEPPEGRRLGNVFVVAAEDGGLGLASLKKNSTRLYLWGRETAGGPIGDAGQWVQRRVIDLKTMLPITSPKRRPCLCGVAEDGSAVFVSTEDGVFTIGIEIESLSMARKVSEVGNVDLLYPFMSFYTESLLLKLASSKNAPPVGDH